MEKKTNSGSALLVITVLVFSYLMGLFFLKYFHNVSLKWWYHLIALPLGLFLFWFWGCGGDIIVFRFIWQYLTFPCLSICVILYWISDYKQILIWAGVGYVLLSGLLYNISCKKRSIAFFVNSLICLILGLVTLIMGFAK